MGSNVIYEQYTGIVPLTIVHVREGLVEEVLSI